MVTSLLIALPLMDYAMTLLSASAQQINATANNEISSRATLITKNETASVHDASDEARKLYAQGHALLELKKFNEAIDLFDKALAINPNNTGVLNDKQTAIDAYVGSQD